MQRFIIIDGNAIVHRAYHALPPLIKANGQNVNAVYGFFTMFLNLLHEQKPEYIAVVFDRSKPTIRQSMYAGYHAHRPQMASDLAPQMPLIAALLEKMQVQIFALYGYEGDDMIGTLARKAVSGKVTSQFNPQEIEVIIVSGDRDMLQLVNKQVKVLMPLTGITKTALFDPAAVEAKYGVRPEQFIDYKALIGDPSDGYPGVSGIGPKTASKLIRQYETFENLYAHAGELPEKIGLKLATDAEQAALAKKLATIICDAPIQLKLAACAVSKFNITSLREELTKHEMKSLVKKLEQQFQQHVKIDLIQKEKSNFTRQLELIES